MFETLKASIAMILDEIAARPIDRHILQEDLREKIAELRALGLPVPEDIEALEQALEDPENDDLWKDLTV
ncbi:hypothetical protein ACRDNQ_16460 [Palleronia sp. KMU-117]|uniref:hypothetical protein n=1 Tax=Palleronia sp. KMU-117 TaxID=3434108 RepID=UPI003D7346F7